MNAFELKEKLMKYSDEELQAMKIWVFCNETYDEGEVVPADNAYTDNTKDLIIDI